MRGDDAYQKELSTMARETRQGHGQAKPERGGKRDGTRSGQGQAGDPTFPFQLKDQVIQLQDQIKGQPVITVLRDILCSIDLDLVALLGSKETTFLVCH